MSVVEEPECRICLQPGADAGDPLVPPCHCEGSVGLCHYSCLVGMLRRAQGAGKALTQQSAILRHCHRDSLPGQGLHDPRCILAAWAHRFQRLRSQMLPRPGAPSRGPRRRRRKEKQRALALLRGAQKHWAVEAGSLTCELCKHEYCEPYLSQLRQEVLLRHRYAPSHQSRLAGVHCALLLTQCSPHCSQGASDGTGVLRACVPTRSPDHTGRECRSSRPERTVSARTPRQHT